MTLDEIRHAVCQGLRCAPDQVTARRAPNTPTSCLVAVRARVAIQLEVQGPLFGKWFVTLRDLDWIADHTMAQHTLEHVIHGPAAAELTRAVHACAELLSMKMRQTGERMIARAFDHRALLFGACEPPPNEDE